MPDIPFRKLSSLSLVIPVYNEEESLPALRTELERLRPAFAGVGVEALLIDDGSSDTTPAFCAAWASEAPWVKVVAFSRNFGHQAAVSAGLRYARGEAVVILDADLQDPPDVIPLMIERYEAGFDVVYGKRRSRSGESRFKLASAWLFYRLMRSFAYKDLPVDAGDFRLMSRRCVDVLNAMPETHRFMRGLAAWAGFRQTAVLYDRRERKHGESKYPLGKMLFLAWDAVSSFSALPVRAVNILGLCFLLFGFAVCLYTLVQHAAGHTVPGWSSLVGLITFIGGLTICSVGIIGEYVGKIFEEVKRRPLYVVEKTLNLDVSIHSRRRRRLPVPSRRTGAGRIAPSPGKRAAGKASRPSLAAGRPGRESP
ncbi:MAG: glycosyltransferase family 2 protein [Desulfovibrio sp.]|nr:glycosyltransferase family 2 protein [Desulfovibrio sp.]